MNTRVVPIASCVLAISLLPGAAALGNEARLVVGESGSVAVCQLAVFVRAVVILGFEDSLGLAARPAQTPLVSALSSAEPTRTFAARCDVLVDTVRIVVPAGEAARVASHVSGPPAVASPGFGNSVSIDAAPGSSVATCQTILLIDSVIIAGGAFGLPTGGGGPLLVAPQEGAADCRVAIGEFEIVENDMRE